MHTGAERVKLTGCTFDEAYTGKLGSKETGRRKLPVHIYRLGASGHNYGRIKEKTMNLVDKLLKMDAKKAEELQTGSVESKRLAKLLGVDKVSPDQRSNHEESMISWLIRLTRKVSLIIQKAMMQS